MTTISPTSQSMEAGHDAATYCTAYRIRPIADAVEEQARSTFETQLLKACDNLFSALTYQQDQLHHHGALRIHIKMEGTLDKSGKVSVENKLLYNDDDSWSYNTAISEETTSLITDFINILCQNARKCFEVQLATNRLALVNALTNNPTTMSGWIECYIHVQAQYNHCDDKLVYTDLSSGKCACAGVSGSKCVQMHEILPCTLNCKCCQYPVFEYKDFTYPTRSSKRIYAASKLAIEKAVSADAYAEWNSKLNGFLSNHWNWLDMNNTSYVNQYIIARELIKACAYMNSSLVTPVVIRHCATTRAVSLHKSRDVIRYCTHTLSHMNDAKCDCFSDYTESQRKNLQTAFTALIHHCKAHIAACRAAIRR